MTAPKLQQVRESRERPILFSGAMVRAILADTKTQTRRVVKNQALLLDGGGRPFTQRWDEAEGVNWRTDITCPHGQPGDRLWVRETWYCDHAFAGVDRCVGCVNCKHTHEDRVREWREEMYYRADVPSGRFEDAGYWGEPGGRWHPSIYMPRWASRITLEVTGVRVERLQDISEEDAKAEGVEACGGFMATAGCWTNYASDGASLTLARASFATLWDSINGDRANWASSPWVWVVEFRRLQP